MTMPRHLLAAAVFAMLACLSGCITYPARSERGAEDRDRAAQGGQAGASDGHAHSH